jgi:adenosine/AMP kinase
MSAEQQGFASALHKPRLRAVDAADVFGIVTKIPFPIRVKNIMNSPRKVAVITGASQGIGAALVKAYRDRNYRVVATARTIKPSNDDDVLAVAGDIADPNTPSA